MRNALTTAAPAVTCRHIDTCVPCYLTDMHDRPGELLIGVSVDRATRVHEVRAELTITAAHGGADEAAPPADAIKAAIAACFAGAHPLKAFDRTLDAAADFEGGEPCQAWFLFTWDVEPEAESVAPPPARMVPMPMQQQQACAARHTDAAHAEAAEWLGYVSACAATALDVSGFDAAVTEAVDALLRRHVITPRAAACLLTFFDVPREPVIAATVAAARMVPMPCQQQQACALKSWVAPTAAEVLTRFVVYGPAGRIGGVMAFGAAHANAEARRLFERHVPPGFHLRVVADGFNVLTGGR